MYEASVNSFALNHSFIFKTLRSGETLYVDINICQVFVNHLFEFLQKGFIRFRVINGLDLGNRRACKIFLDFRPVQHWQSLDLFFISKDSTQRIGVLAADEGFFKSNQWIATRRLNGDETHASTWDGTGIKMPDDKPGMQKIILYHYR